MSQSTVAGAAPAVRPTGPATRSDRYLTFMIGGEAYALGILDITEILASRPLTVVPMMPAFIRGVINLRGRVVPVIDMAARFGSGSTAVARRTAIIIVEVASAGTGEASQRQDVGIMVDAVNEVITLDDDQIEPPPSFGAGIRADFISGMARRDGDFIIVLDVSRVLSVEEMAAVSQAAMAQVDVAATGDL